MTFLRKNLPVWVFAFLATALIGFYGCTDEDCGTLDCGANGTCDSATSTCVCELGYWGAQCENFSACLADETLCGENQTCNSETGECDCDEGWYGENCDSNDPCTDVECIDNAECVDGTCECVDGFEGDECQTQWVTKLLGSWVQTDECGTEMYVSDVVIGNTGTNTGFTISNFGGLQDSPPIVVTANLVGPSSWEMNFQTVDGFDVEGTTLGSYNVSELTGDESLAITYTVNSQSCIAVFTRP